MPEDNPGTVKKWLGLCSYCLTSGAVNTVTDTAFLIVLETIIEKQCKVEELFKNELLYCWT